MSCAPVSCCRRFAKALELGREPFAPLLPRWPLDQGGRNGGHCARMRACCEVARGGRARGARVASGHAMAPATVVGSKGVVPGWCAQVCVCVYVSGERWCTLAVVRGAQRHCGLGLCRRVCVSGAGRRAPCGNGRARAWAWERCRLAAKVVNKFSLWTLSAVRGEARICTWSYRHRSRLGQNSESCPDFSKVFRI